MAIASGTTHYQGPEPDVDYILSEVTQTPDNESVKRDVETPQLRSVVTGKLFIVHFPLTHSRIRVHKTHTNRTRF